MTTVRADSTIEVLNLRQQAARLLRARIVAGELPPGSLHAVGPIAASLGVSITPVREAVLDLAKDGLVAMVRNRGFRIAEPSERDLDEILQVRLMLEVAAVGEVTRSRSIADFSQLRVHAARTAAMAERQDWSGLVDSDRELHMTLLAAAGNARLSDIVSTLRDQTRLYGLNRPGAAQVVESTREHDAILDAVEAGDVAEAQSLVAHHLAHARGVWAGRSE